MNRRNFAKQALATAVTAAVVPNTGWEQSLDGGRSYDSATISVRLLPVEPGRTAVRLTEHGDADQVLVQAFYRTTLNGQRLMLHKEASCPLYKGSIVETDLLMDVADIVFLRVSEMKMIKVSEFGKVPE